MPTLTDVDALAQLAFLVQGALERRAAAHDLSIVQIRLLGILRDRRPTMHELSLLLGVEKSSTTGLIDRAARRGLVRRVRATDDRRAVHVALTDAGRTLGMRVASAFESDVSAMLAELPSRDRATLVRLAERVLVAEARSRGIDLFEVDAPVSTG